MTEMSDEIRASLERIDELRSYSLTIARAQGEVSSLKSWFETIDPEFDDETEAKLDEIFENLSEELDTWLEITNKFHQSEQTLLVGMSTVSVFTSDPDELDGTLSNFESFDEVMELADQIRSHIETEIEILRYIAAASALEETDDGEANDESISEMIAKLEEIQSKRSAAMGKFKRTARLDLNPDQVL